MTRIIPFLLAFFFLVSSLSGQTIYLKYDETCMDRLEYSSDAEAVAYVSYRFELGEGKIIHFDVGKEAAKWVRDLPGKVIRCEDFIMDKEYVRRVNVGAIKIFMVRESPTHYNISAVDKATYINNFLSGVEVVMDDAEYVLDLNNLVSNRNLSKPASGMAVFLEGTSNYQCVKGYTVKKMENTQSDSYKEYVLVPELGLVEKRSVSGSGAVITGRLKLNKVDELSFSEALSGICDGIQASYYDASQPAVATGTNTVKTIPDDAATIPTGYGDTPCGTQSPGYHFVQKGETLYSISRRYGVTVNQLEQWNGLANSNVINICQKLQVAASPPANTINSSGTAAIEGTDGQGHWVRNAAVHVVRPGESVAALATMYGYTEERFRKMNNLSAYERIYAGQQLHTSDCACPTGESTTVGTPMPYGEDVSVVASLTEKGNPDVYFRPIKIHEVKTSETLFSIAKLYDTTVDRVRELNGLGSNAKLAAGQRLYVQ